MSQWMIVATEQKKDYTFDLAFTLCFRLDRITQWTIVATRHEKNYTFDLAFM